VVTGDEVGGANGRGLSCQLIRCRREQCSTTVRLATSRYKPLVKAEAAIAEGL
jgi:hypothetical protein